MLDGLRAVVDAQRRRLEILQERVDLEGDAVARSVSLPTAADAITAAESYSSEWFARQPYSTRVLSAIARALIDAAQPYPFVDTSTWERVAKEGES